MRIAAEAGRWHDRGVARRIRTITPLKPRELGSHNGLSYSLWVPDAEHPPTGGVAILHGAGSCKENHHDFARASVAEGLAAIAFDARGPRESGQLT